jgi:hypothetical protein
LSGIYRNTVFSVVLQSSFSLTLLQLRYFLRNGSNIFIFSCWNQSIFNGLFQIEYWSNLFHHFSSIKGVTSLFFELPVYHGVSRMAGAIHSDLCRSIAFKTPLVKVKVTVTKNRKMVCTITKVRNEILLSNLVYSKLMWRPRLVLVFGPPPWGQGHR